MSRLPKRQRVGAYAVILRGEQILLSRLAPHISHDEMWTLPGGGLDHGEDPRDAVLREVLEETGLDAEIGELARVYSAHVPTAWREGRRVDAHALRIVYDGWVPHDAPEPRVLEVDGSTSEAAWKPVSDVLDGTVPVASLVVEALADHLPVRRQRVAAYALVRRGDDVLLTRMAPHAPGAGSWTLPGGGVDHGESPRRTLEREIEEECALDVVVGDLLDVHDVHFTGTAPSGRVEDFHGVHLVFDAGLAPGAAANGADEPRVVEQGGTTDAAAWVAVADIEQRRVPVNDLVRHVLSLTEADPGTP